MKKIAALLIFLTTLVVYFFHPTKFDRTYIVLCGFLYVAIVFLYYRLIKKENYFDFDSIFIFAYFLATMYYPLFLHGKKIDFFVYLYSFNVNSIPQGVGLSLLGLSSYVSGALIYKTRLKKISNKQLIKKTISNNSLYILSLASFLLYVVTGGYQKMINLYQGVHSDSPSGVISSYLFLFCPIFLLVALIIEFVQMKDRYTSFSIMNFNKLGLFTTILILVLMLLTGSRTIPIQIVLACGGLYAYLFKPINFIKFLQMMFAGVFSLFLLLGIRGAIADNFTFSDIFSDLFGVNRSIFVAIDYVDKYDYTYGESMLGSLLAPIPFGQNIFINLLGFDPDMMASSLLYTKYTLGSTSKGLGLGTTIVADLYFSFGFIGVIICMFSLGYFVRRKMITGQSNIFSLTSYIIIISYAVFLVRAEFFTPLRMIIWSLIVLKITMSFRRII